MAPSSCLWPRCFGSRTLALAVCVVAVLLWADVVAVEAIVGNAHSPVSSSGSAGGRSRASHSKDRIFDQ
jgi:hypothetical protein